MRFCPSHLPIRFEGGRHQWAGVRGGELCAVVLININVDGYGGGVLKLLFWMIRIKGEVGTGVWQYLMEMYVSSMKMSILLVECRQF